jgi:HD superfamily phosphodiesterase
VWERAEKLLRKAIKKDFVLHTKYVVKAMEKLVVKEGGESDILIPAAILHDVGWSEVSEKLQLAADQKGSLKAQVEHIEKVPMLIRKILGGLNYSEENIGDIVRVVKAHRFVKPTKLDEKLLIDADTLSDTYKEVFYSNIESYNTTPEAHLDFRSKNTFYTKTARKIFEKQLMNRLEEIKNS